MKYIFGVKIRGTAYFEVEAENRYEADLAFLHGAGEQIGKPIYDEYTVISIDEEEPWEKGGIRNED